MNQDVINHASSRSDWSKAGSMTKAEKPKKSELSKDLLDSGRPQNRRWTVSGGQPKSGRSSRGQELPPDAPFGQSMLKKTDGKCSGSTKPTESAAQVPFGPSKLRRVNSRGSDDVKDRSPKRPSENPFGKVVLRQTSKEDMKVIDDNSH